MQERAALQRALAESRTQLDKGRALAARLRDAGHEINPHGLGREILETLPAEIAVKEARLAAIARELAGL